MLIIKYSVDFHISDGEDVYCWMMENFQIQEIKTEDGVFSIVEINQEEIAFETVDTIKLEPEEVFEPIE